MMTYTPGSKVPLVLAGACLVLGYLPSLVVEAVLWVADRVAAVDDALVDFGGED